MKMYMMLGNQIFNIDHISKLQPQITTTTSTDGFPLVQLSVEISTIDGTKHVVKDTTLNDVLRELYKVQINPANQTHQKLIRETNPPKVSSKTQM